MLENPKIASGIIAAGASAETSSLLGWIPNDIGNLVSLLNGVLVLLLIGFHWRRDQREKLELRVKLAQIEKRRDD